MKIIFSMIVAIICSNLALVTLDIEKAKKYRSFYLSGREDEYNVVVLPRKTVVIGTIVVFFLSFCTVMRILYGVSDVLNIIKMITALFMLTGSACFDFREQRIPNIFPIILSVLGVIFLIAGVLIKQAGAWDYVISSAFAAFGCVLGLLCVSALTNKGIGAGDVKLMGALALLGGVYLVCGVLFFSVVSCAITAVVLLVLKKKTLKEVIPFAPFILIGFCISIFASIY